MGTRKQEKSDKEPRAPLKRWGGKAPIKTPKKRNKLKEQEVEIKWKGKMGGYKTTKRR